MGLTNDFNMLYFSAVPPWRDSHSFTERRAVSGDGDFSKDAAVMPLAAHAAAILRSKLQLFYKSITR